MWQSVFRRWINIVKWPFNAEVNEKTTGPGGGRARRSTWRRNAGLELVFCLACLIGVGMIGTAAASSSAASTAAVNRSSYKYLRAHQPYAQGGTQRCLTCHNSPPVNYILKTPMGVTADSRTPMGQHGCESCHGPSGYHAELKMVDGKLILPPILFQKPKINVGVGASPVATQNNVCLSCHQGNMPINWMGSPHQVNQLTCATCHTVHALKDPVLSRQTQPEVCFKCHQDIRAMSFEYSHHPIREGKVVCMDCHNPMGGVGPYQLKEFTVNQTCYQCHADKRGPFLWEHQPVRDNCLNCHTPHGSNQQWLLKEPVNFLCDSCHSVMSNQSSGSFGGAQTIPFGSPNGAHIASAEMSNQRDCLNCHSHIHGSNSPSGAFFLR